MAVEEVSKPIVLGDYIASRLRTPFSWGDHDCGSFVLVWAKLHTGIDFRARLGHWSDEEGAKRVLVSAGGLEKICDSFFKPINPHMATDGDIGYVGRSVCLFSGPHVVGPSPDGLVFIDRMRVKCAWSY